LQIGQAVNKFGSRDIRWSSEGMLRIELTLMKQLFKPTIDKIKEVTLPFFKILYISIDLCLSQLS
jgi:hypothetical protein